MDTHIRTDCVQSLLPLATGRNILAATPLAFDEGATKGRVKNPRNYKKPQLWITVVCVLILAMAMMMPGPNPETAEGVIVPTDEEEPTAEAGVDTAPTLDETTIPPEETVIAPQETVITPEETTITMVIEGDCEEIPAQIVYKDGYSIAIPTEDFVEVDNNHWQAIVNEDVYFHILCLDTADIQEVATVYLGTEGELLDWMGRDSIFVSNAGNTHFLTALGSSENGDYYGLGQCSNEAMEGFGSRIGYVFGTFQL